MEGGENWRERRHRITVIMCETYRHQRTNPGTEAEPQQIVAQRLLSCLQHHVPFKSSTKDLTRPTFCIAVKYRVDPKAIATPTPVEVNIVTSSMDSDLEAFSHNPTDDSFAALAAQPTALPNI